MSTKRRLSAVRCRHDVPHKVARLVRGGTRFDGRLVFLCATCTELLEPLLEPVDEAQAA